MNTTPPPPKETAIENQGAEGCRAAATGSVIVETECAECEGEGQWEESGHSGECFDCGGLGVLLTLYGKEIAEVVERIARRDFRRTNHARYVH